METHDHQKDVARHFELAAEYHKKAHEHHLKDWFKYYCENLELHFTKLFSVTHSFLFLD
jgi:hypothetical protein